MRHKRRPGTPLVTRVAADMAALLEDEAWRNRISATERLDQILRHRYATREDWPAPPLPRGEP